MDSTPRSRLLYWLALIVSVLMLVSLNLGMGQVSMIDLFTAGDAAAVWLILVEIRLPRTMIAAITGASLGLCGAAMQGLLRNPLASPGLIGSSSGAALGAVIVLYLGLSQHNWLLLPFGGMLGALVALILVYLLAGRDASIVTIVLAGVAINALAISCVSLILNFAPSPYAVQEIVLWTLGSVSNLSMNDLWILLPPTLLGWLLFIGTGRSLDLLTLGEDTAQSMGIDLVFLRTKLFVAVALCVGAAVSITGAIGFIGLVVPHLLRPLVGYQPGRLLIASAFGGASMLLGADIVVRLMPPGPEIKIGVLTAIVGAPFFLFLILKTRRWQI
ncbi:MAG: iron ABC transporter permease [Arenicellales bacterium]|nr:iron ABC transporter permease [Arenicellales bacterium]